MDEFVAMLKSFQIELVADIRSFPGSRRFPHFNKETLEVTLSQNNLIYIHIKNLGGRRKVNPNSKNTSLATSSIPGLCRFYGNRSF